MTELQSPTIFSSDGVAAALTGSLSLEAIFAMLQSVAVAANSSDTAINTDLSNKINTLQTQVAEAIRKADKLEDYEKGQIESILQTLIASDGFQQLMQQAVITVNGQSVSMASALEGILSAPRPTGVALAYDGIGAITGATIALSDGTSAYMPAEFTVGDEGLPTEYKICTFASENFANKGFPASFVVHTTAVKKSIGVLGIGDVTVGYRIKQYSNILFSFNAATGAAVSVATPDINGDGVIGEPTATTNTGNSSEFNIP